MQRTGDAMSEFQKIAIGLLGLTHPEVHRLRLDRSQESKDEFQKPEAKDPNSRPGALLRGAKFAFAALVAGSQAIPMGDNGCVTRDLAAYGARLRMN
jgi:hypothetical protein